MLLQRPITCRANTLLFVGSSTIALRMFRTSRGREALHRRPAPQRRLLKIFADPLAPSCPDSQPTLRKLRIGSTCPSLSSSDRADSLNFLQSDCAQAQSIFAEKNLCSTSSFSWQL